MMADFTNKTPPSQIDPRERARQLGAVYKTILDWKQSAAPDDLGPVTGTAEEETPDETGCNTDSTRKMDDHGASKL